jgi:hypothetical protein
MQDVENVRASRGSLPTVPEQAGKASAADQDRPSIPLERPRLTWAVAFGDHDVRAMSTFDLWRSLSLGEMQGSTPVWRVGRECWTPAIEIPELACALRVSLHEVPVAPPQDDAPRVTVDYITAPPSFGLGEGAEAEAESEPTPLPPPRLRLSLPEMIFDPLELSQLEAAVREKEIREADVANAAVVPEPARLEPAPYVPAPYEPAPAELPPCEPASCESPSSELPQAVVLPPRISSIELDAERPTVLPKPRKKKRSPVWAATAGLAIFGVLLAPAVASDAEPKRPAELDNRVSAAANRASSVIAHGPQAQARIEGEAVKVVLPPRPQKKSVSPKIKNPKGQARKGRASAR